MRKVVAGLLAWFVGTIAVAGEISVLSGGAVEPGLHAAVAAFQKQTGHQVNVTFNTTPQIQKRIAAGDTFDVLIAPPATLEQFVEHDRIESGFLNVGRVGSGVAVRPGAPVPAIASADDIRKAVLEAESVVFNRASTGIYFENLLKKMGVWEQVQPKTVRYATGAEVMKHTLKGKGREVAFGPITEILLEKDHGLVFVGPLPSPIQNYTSYTAVAMRRTGNVELSQELVKFLGSPEGRKIFAAAGVE